MAGPLDTYNREIMETECPRCNRQGTRCVGSLQASMVPQPSHKARRTAAGFNWNAKAKKLERVPK